MRWAHARGFRADRVARQAHPRLLAEKPRTFTDQHTSADARRRNSLIEKGSPETPADSEVFPLHGPASANEELKVLVGNTRCRTTTGTG